MFTERFKGSFKNVSRVLQERLKGILRQFLWGCLGYLKKVKFVYQGSAPGVSKKFQGSLESASRVFQERFNGVSRNIEGCFKGIFKLVSRVFGRSSKGIPGKFPLSPGVLGPGNYPGGGGEPSGPTAIFYLFWAFLCPLVSMLNNK